MSDEDVNRPSYWDGLYAQKEDGWELGGPSPPLARIIRTLAAKATPRAVVPGCGRGHEVIALAEHGIDATGLDFAVDAVAGARANIERAFAAGRLKAPARVERIDLFTAASSNLGPFDLAVEHTCFCAIDVARRDEYVQVIADLLRPGGKLIGLFYAHERPGGPPYATTEKEVRERLAARFDVVRAEVAPDSIDRRKDNELFVEAVRR